MPKQQTHKPVETEAKAEASPEPSAPISFAEPISAADLTAGVADKPEYARPLISDAMLVELQRQAGHDNEKRDFTIKVLEARAKAVEAPPAPPPVAIRIAEQTNAELEAGRKMNEHYVALQVHRPRPPVDTGTQSVFRPEDYVPDQKKGQGNNLQARTL